MINVTNEGGSISFTFTDLTTNEVKKIKDHQSGEIVIPLTKGVKLN